MSKILIEIPDDEVGRVAGAVLSKSGIQATEDKKRTKLSYIKFYILRELSDLVRENEKELNLEGV